MNFRKDDRVSHTTNFPRIAPSDAKRNVRSRSGLPLDAMVGDAYASATLCYKLLKNKTLSSDDVARVYDARMRRMNGSGWSRSEVAVSRFLRRIGDREIRIDQLR